VVRARDDGSAAKMGWALTAELVLVGVFLRLRDAG